MVKVPNNVLRELELIRISGAVNMLDISAVIRHAERLGLQSAAAWVRGNKPLYWKGVFDGFEAE